MGLLPMKSFGVSDQTRMNITCPYCWQPIDIEDTFPIEEAIEFVTDCEVCCRPIKVVANWNEDSNDFLLDVEPES